MNTDDTEGIPYIDDFYIPHIDPPPEVQYIDESNPSLDQILDSFFYVPPSPFDVDAFFRSYDPRKTYNDGVRRTTMKSLDEDGRLVGGPHCLPPKPLLFMNLEARERALRTDGTQYEGPSGAVSWYYRAGMDRPPPIRLDSSVLLSRKFLPAGGASEIGIDPLQTIGDIGIDIPAWRRGEETLKKRKRVNSIRKNGKKAGPRKRKKN